MARHIQDSRGRFAGSIGDGKTHTPTVAPAIPARGAPSQPVDSSDALLAAYAAFHATRPTTPPEPATPVDPAGTVTLSSVWGQTFTIPEGNLDEAHHVLTNGHCHSLAFAIHAQTGWDLVAFKPVADGRRDDNGFLWPDGPEFEQFYMSHVAVLTPEGDVLDANGLRTLEDVEEDENWETLDHLNTPEAVQAHIAADDATIGRSTWLPADPAAVASFVTPVLEQYKTILGRAWDDHG